MKEYGEKEGGVKGISKSNYMVLNPTKMLLNPTNILLNPTKVILNPTELVIGSKSHSVGFATKLCMCAHVHVYFDLPTFLQCMLVRIGSLKGISVMQPFCRMASRC